MAGNFKGVQIKLIRPLRSGPHTVNAYQVENIGSTFKITFINYQESTQIATVHSQIVVPRSLLVSLYEDIDLSNTDDPETIH